MDKSMECLSCPIRHLASPVAVQIMVLEMVTDTLPLGYGRLQVWGHGGRGETLDPSLMLLSWTSGMTEYRGEGVERADCPCFK